MSTRTTLIIMATPGARPGWTWTAPDSAAGPLLPDFQHIAQTLDTALEAGLDVVLLSSRWVQQQCEVFAPEITCVSVPALDATPPGPDQWAQAVSAGVQASGLAKGWIVMPWPMWQVRHDTLQALDRALTQHTMVCPVFQGQSGQPVGLSSELYSELSQLTKALQWRRLWARYPSASVAVTDPGVLSGDALPLEWPALCSMDARPLR